VKARSFISKRLSSRGSLGRATALLLLIGALALRIADPAPVELLRFKTFDLYQLLIKPPDLPEQVAIVDIDEASLNRVGQWPWPRTTLAQLVEKLTAYGAPAIAIDILFPEYDRMSPGALAEIIAGDDAVVAQHLKSLPSNDQKFADAVAASHVVLGQAVHETKNSQWHAKAREQTGIAMVGPGPDRYLDAYPGLVRNVPELENAAAGLGLVSVRPDADGIIRKVPLMLKADDRVLPSLGLELLRVATGESTILLRGDDAGVNSVVLAGVTLPTDESGYAWLQFRPHDPKIFISASDVLDGKLPAGALQNRLVIIGSSATGLFDLKATPVDAVMPGAEIHAQLVSAMINGNLLKRPNWAPGTEVALTLFLGLTMIMLIPRLGAAWTLAVGASAALAVIASAFWLFTEKGLIIDFVFPLLATLLVTGVMVVMGYLNEEIERRQIRAAFGQYLSPELVDQLAANPERLVLGGETRTMTVLFSDVRGFTALSETYKDNPQGLTTLINRLLTPLSAAVIRNRGTIDKYMGDNVMAFWNAPLPDEDHAGNACRAALAMLGELAALNTTRQNETGPDGTPVKPLQVGVGINTGQCVVGNMGSEQRFDYTVLGDSVNLASRLEGQTKSYGVRILLGEATAAMVKDRFAVLPLDRIRVVGKKEPEEIFTLVGTEDCLASAEFQVLRAAHATAIQSYLGRHWDELDAHLAACRSAAAPFHIEGLYDKFAARAEVFRKDPPPADWDGVFEAKSK
jgi:adenylate cyclase